VFFIIQRQLLVNFIFQQLHDNIVCPVPAITAEHILKAFKIMVTLLHWIPSTRNQCQQVGDLYKSQVPAVARGGLSPDSVAQVFAFSLLCYYLSIVQIKPFRTTPSHSAVESQIFWVGVNIFSLSAFAGWGADIFSFFPRKSYTRYWWTCKKHGLRLLCKPKTQFLFTH